MESASRIRRISVPNSHLAKNTEVSLYPRATADDSTNLVLILVFDRVGNCSSVVLAFFSGFIGEIEDEGPKQLPKSRKKNGGPENPKYRRRRKLERYEDIRVAMGLIQRNGFSPISRIIGVTGPPNIIECVQELALHDSRWFF